MAKTLSSAWILPTVKAALGVEGGNLPTGAPTDARPKVVQVVRASTQDGYLEVSDRYHTIPVFLTPEARAAFAQAMPQKTLAGLPYCLIKLERWLVSYQPIAMDSASGPRMAHHPDFKQNHLAPLCLQASKFTVVASEANLSKFGNPVSVNNFTKIEDVQQCLHKIPSPTALMAQLATAQGIPRLPDSIGKDVLPEAGQRIVTWQEVESMLCQDRNETEERIAGVVVMAAAGGGRGEGGGGGEANDGIIKPGHQQEVRPASPARTTRAAAAATQQQQEQQQNQRVSHEDGDGNKTEEDEPPLPDNDDRLASQFGASPTRNILGRGGEEEEEEVEEEQALPPALSAPASPAHSTRSTGAARDFETQQRRGKEEEEEEEEEVEEAALPPALPAHASPARSNRSRAAAREDFETQPGQGDEEKEGERPPVPPSPARSTRSTMAAAANAKAPSPVRSSPQKHRGEKKSGGGGGAEETKEAGSSRYPLRRGLPEPAAKPPAPPVPAAVSPPHRRTTRAVHEVQTQALTQVFSQTQVDATQQSQPEEEEEEEEKGEEGKAEQLRAPSPPPPARVTGQKRPASTAEADGGGGGPSTSRARPAAPVAAAASASAPAEATSPPRRGAPAAVAALRTANRSTSTATSSGKKQFGGRSTIWGLMGLLKKPVGGPDARQGRRVVL